MVKYLLVKLLDRASISISIDSDRGEPRRLSAVRCSAKCVRAQVACLPSPLAHQAYIYIYTTGYILNASVYYIHPISAYYMCKACGMPLDCG